MLSKKMRLVVIPFMWNEKVMKERNDFHYSYSIKLSQGMHKIQESYHSFAGVALEGLK
jgi:hypothetical protein